jgi:hypothetical protein|tara:strand:+ start:767 stop:907 length:141 start_codon:yes stop_codon:yes gene_type:complete
MNKKIKKKIPAIKSNFNASNTFRDFKWIPYTNIMVAKLAHPFERNM